MSGLGLGLAVAELQSGSGKDTWEEPGSRAAQRRGVTLAQLLQSFYQGHQLPYGSSSPKPRLLSPQKQEEKCLAPQHGDIISKISCKNQILCLHREVRWEIFKNMTGYWSSHLVAFYIIALIWTDFNCSGTDVAFCPGKGCILHQGYYVGGVSFNMLSKAKVPLWESLEILGTTALTAGVSLGVISTRQ